MPIAMKILIALGILLISNSLLYFMGVLFAVLITGIPLASFLHPDMQHASAAFVSAFKIIQVFADIGTFIIPAIALVYLFFGVGPARFMGINKPVNPLPVVIAICLALTIQPLVDLSARLNEMLHLPNLFHGINMDDKMEILMQKLLYMPHMSDLLINILFVAILPAVAEELFFRGFLQKTLQKWIKNAHVAVFIAAFVFSFIHFEFSGLLPRMLLGLLLGYVFLWSGDIKLSILIHFTNNFLDLMQVWYMQQQGKPVSQDIIGPPLPVYIYIVTIILVGSLLYVFKTKTQASINISDENN
jgi:uncharacterized protein